MQIANALVAIGGDTGNTVPRYGVTAAEVAVLMSVHGDAAVTEIEPTGDVKRSNRAELLRLRETYGAAKGHDNEPVLNTLFPGAAARVFETFEELEIDESLYKASSRVAPSPAKSVTSDQDKADDTPAAEAEAEAEDEGDGLDDMTKAQLFEAAEARGVEFPTDVKKNADMVAFLRERDAKVAQAKQAKQTEEPVGDEMPDAGMFR